MAEDPRTQLLRQLQQGQTSRSRDYERFCQADARRVLRAHWRLAGLARDLVRPGVQARSCWVEPRGALAVAVESEALRYRRLVLLAPWEAEFFLRETIARGVLPSPAGAGAPDP